MSEPIWIEDDLLMVINDRLLVEKVAARACELVWASVSNIGKLLRIFRRVIHLEFPCLVARVNWLRLPYERS